ncbi:COG3014 family protein [Marinobacter sp. X15-166B]|uniref:COG3014 family protein n=1 Tax=Marinobacter sp. X15-166B TaxID=1897620 RepID=UPI00085C1931|nr:hypothetical protein [Marinobacter sp. X15-166B]OEY65503.1 hypothetical protein BG841_02865 [Marinobacter sp. X15-166B]
MKLLNRIFLVISVVVLLSGCSAAQHRNQMNLFNSAYATGDYDSALSAVGFDITEGQPIDSEAHLLNLLHQGELYRLSGRYQESTQAFDLAEEGMKYLDNTGVIGSAAENLLAIMVNDSERDYQALMSEAVLVNTYKGLAFLAAGNNEYARIEFNRADDRTRRAVEYFQNEIAQQQAALEKEAEDKESNAFLVNDNLNSASLHEAVAQNYETPSGWSVLPEFIVPSSTYLHGIYFIANAAGSSDYERAATSLKRVADMNNASAVLQADAKLASALASGRQNPGKLEPQVWVVYENGLGPVLEETRFEVPLLLFADDEGTSKLTYYGIALPKYAERPAVPGSIGVVGDSGEAIQTEHLSDMGTVIRTEMKERFPGVLARAVSSAVVKAVIQNQAADRFGLAGQLGASVFALATTQADLRGWQAMPNHWQAARVNRPESGVLTLIDHQGDILGRVNIPQQPFTLVYVKRPTTHGPATVVTMDLQGNRPATLVSLPELQSTPAQVSSVH